MRKRPLRVDKETTSTRVFIFNCPERVYKPEPPRMYVGRHNHSSCILKRKLYVFGGATVDSKDMLSSIEFCDLSAPYNYWA